MSDTPDAGRKIRQLIADHIHELNTWTERWVVAPDFVDGPIIIPDPDMEASE